MITTNGTTPCSTRTLRRPPLYRIAATSQVYVIIPQLGVILVELRKRDSQVRKRLVQDAEVRQVPTYIYRGSRSGSRAIGLFDPPEAAFDEKVLPRRREASVCVGEICAFLDAGM